MGILLSKILHLHPQSTQIIKYHISGRWILLIVGNDAKALQPTQQYHIHSMPFYKKLWLRMFKSVRECVFPLKNLEMKIFQYQNRFVNFGKSI